METVSVPPSELRPSATGIRTARLRLPPGFRPEAVKPRLRFDKVALRLVADMAVAVREASPTGVIVIVTVTAPIRLASRTAAARSSCSIT